MKSSRSRSITATELLGYKVDKMPCIIEPIFQRVGLSAIGGSSDTSKSSLLRDMAIAVCTGQEEYLGWKINAKHSSVIYVSTEDDKYSIAYLLQKQNADKKLDDDCYNNLRYVFDTEHLLDYLDEALTEQPADLVIIDAFSDLFTGSINDSNQVRSYLNEYNQLAQEHECLVIFLHHTGKRTEETPPSKHNLLGSQGFEAKMRVVVELRKDRQDSSLRHLCVVKGNYLPEEYKQSSYVLKFSENMTFSNTGQRVPIGRLGGSQEQDARIEQAKELSVLGQTQQQIATQLKVDKSTISRWLKK